MQKMLSDVKDPTVKEILVGIASATAGRMASLQVESVVASAINAEIFNHLTHAQQEQLKRTLEEARNNPEKIAEILEYYIRLSLANRLFNPEAGEYMEDGTINELNEIKKLGDCGVKFEVNENLGLHENLKAAREFLNLYFELKDNVPDFFGEVVKGGCVAAAGATTPIGAALIISDIGCSVYKAYGKTEDIVEAGNQLGIELGKEVVFNFVEDAINKKYKVSKAVFVVTESVINVIIDNRLEE